METFSFEQWVLFLAVSFRQRYRSVAQASFPELEARLPLLRGGQLTVVQVNAGETVHFLFEATQEAKPTACRALSVQPPEGMSLQDWATLHREGFMRFVERSLGAEPVGHIVLFPQDGDEHATVLLEAERLAREHAAGLRAAG